MEITYKEKDNLVYVTFKNSDNKKLIEESLNNFHNLWINYYKNKKDFYFIFDTTKIKPQNILLCVEYSYKFMKIIDYFKTYETQYLKSNILIINNDIVKNLFYTIFLVKTPLTTIFITKSTQQCQELIQCIFSKNNIDDYIKSNNITYII